MIKPQIVNKLKSINELMFLDHISYFDNWKHDKYSRVQMTDKFNIAEVTFKVMLKSLRTRNIIDKISKGVYRINKDIIQ